MMEKIKWYQEILRLDPDSRVFFLLAQAYRELGRTEEAIAVLRSGLEHVPTYLEARLLLIQILFDTGRADDCFPELTHVASLFEAYPAFWEVWAESAAAARNKDLALAARLMASTLRHPEYSLARIIESGLTLLQDVRNTFAVPSAPCEAVAPANFENAAVAGVEAALVPSCAAEAASEPDPFFADTAAPDNAAPEAALLPPIALFAESAAPRTPLESRPGMRLFADEPFADVPCTGEPCAAAPLDAEALVAAQAGAAEPAADMNAAFVDAESAELVDTASADTEPVAPESDTAQPEPAAEATSEELFGSEIASLKALSFFRDSALEEEDEDSFEEGEPTLHTRSMADVLAAQGDIVGALEIYQELEAAAPTPEEAQVLHDCVVALAARISAGEGEVLPTEGEGSLSAPAVPQNRLMSLLESLADRLEARARA